jgi:hypothetical protein
LWIFLNRPATSIQLPASSSIRVESCTF